MLIAGFGRALLARAGTVWRANLRCANFALTGRFDRVKRMLLFLKAILAALSLLCARRSCGGSAADSWA